MKELVERLRALRTNVTLESVFDKQTSTAESSKSCAATTMGYSKM
ncbi:hypothetical protein EV385_3164 [Krasilnikovia cinnamomea]|uniref:Uncharacterized protein n=1 Tax=Krasilnikovia cinnamomea TaxID=349313 RepID=A0A4Q7ZM69_9ACTN|nr:hypothetical protein [Krasilnikovia cinnamomea]RZU51349.1 hypothetical protein EV385_3164 [Krasilnikovia cinnamomea]